MLVLVLLGTTSMASFVPTSAAEMQNEPIRPLKASELPKLDQVKVRLGERLFNDKRLSTDNSISCASCHDLSKGGTDGKKFAVGLRGQIGPINTPTVFNASLNFKQFWDGRADTLEAQIHAVLHNPKELNSNWSEVQTKLRQDAMLVSMFASSYKDGITEGNIKDAIAIYERSLVTPSRFDRYLLGDTTALKKDEIQGYTLFKKYGCVACHQGVNVGGNMFQRFGLFGQYFEKRGGLTAADLGRFNVTRQEQDKHVFKVPSLRNVALTAPYFHDGSATTLEEAVSIMFAQQLGRTAPEADKKYIVQFLESLTGESLEKKQ